MLASQAYLHQTNELHSSAEDHLRPLTQVLKGALFCRAHRLATKAEATQAPTLSGPFAEHLLLSVYKTYTTWNPNGLMDLQAWRRFVDDSGVLKFRPKADATRRRSNNLEPDDDDELEPIRLFKAVLFMHEADLRIASEYDGATLQHFWVLLCRLARLVHPVEYLKAPADALDRLLREVLLPLYLHRQHNLAAAPDRKQGLATQAALAKDYHRIFLLLHDYAPNLWHLFCSYATDPLGGACAPRNRKGTTPPPAEFPFEAQASERNLTAAYTRRVQVIPGDELASVQGGKTPLCFQCMTPAAFVRCAEEFGISPALLTRGQLTDIFDKVVAHRKHEAQLWSDAFTAPYTGQGSSSSAAALQLRIMKYLSVSGRRPARPTRGGREVDQHQAPGALKRRGMRIATTPTLLEKAIPDFEAGFCDFQEMIVHAALQGLSGPQHQHLFPSPFAKVSALLTQWGLADLDKVAQVRSLSTDEANPLVAETEWAYQHWSRT